MKAQGSRLEAPGSRFGRSSRRDSHSRLEGETFHSRLGATQSRLDPLRDIDQSTPPCFHDSRCDSEDLHNADLLPTRPRARHPRGRETGGVRVGRREKLRDVQKERVRRVEGGGWRVDELVEGGEEEESVSPSTHESTDALTLRPLVHLPHSLTLSTAHRSKASIELRASPPPALSFLGPGTR